MKIPNKIVVGPFTYEIKFTNDDLKNDNGHRLFGEARHFEQLIMIDSKAKTEQISETFIHEVVHCLDAVYKFSDKDLPEIAVERLGTSLFKFIVDNPEVFK